MDYLTKQIKIIRMLLNWKYIQHKAYAISAALLREGEAILSKVSSRSPGLECSYEKICQPGFSYEHNEIFKKDKATRRDLGKRASPVDRAHMKRPKVPLTPDEVKNLVLFSLGFENLMTSRAHYRVCT